MSAITTTLHGVSMLTAETARDPLPSQIDHQFTYQSPTPEAVAQMAQIREQAKALAHTIAAHCPPSADRSAAIRSLRECVMTANASIVLGGK